MAAFPTQPIAKLTGHKGLVHAVAYSSGASNYILTGDADKTIRLFNPERAPPSSVAPPTSSRKPPPGLVNKYIGHGLEVLSIDVNAANDRFVSTGGDKSIFVWDVETAQSIIRWHGHDKRVNRGIFGGDEDSVIISGSYDGTVKIWDIKSGARDPIMTLRDATDEITDVAVHDAEILASSVDGRVRSYDIRMGMCHADVIGESCTSLAVSKKGTEFLVSLSNSTIKLMDRSNGELLKTYQDDAFVNKEYRVKSVLGLNDSVVVSGSDNGRIFAWDTLDGTCLHRFKHSEMREVNAKASAEKSSSEKEDSKKDVVSAVTYCKKRNEWCSGGGDGNVVVWGMA